MSAVDSLIKVVEVRRQAIRLSSVSGTKIPRRVLSLALCQGLQVEHKRSRSTNDVTDTKVSKRYVERQSSTLLGDTKSTQLQWP